MSDEQNNTKSVAAAKNAINDLVAAALDLKEKKPKVFFGAIGGVVLLLLFMMIGGGSGPAPVSGPTIKELAVGQKYVLKSPNSIDPNATIRLVPVPGTLAAYDDTEEKDRNEVCQHMPQNTPVEVQDFSDAYGNKKMFVKVKVLSGDCKDKDGWVLAIDVQ